MSGQIVWLGRVATMIAVAVVSAGAVDLQPRATDPADIAVRAARWLEPSSGQMRGPVVIVVSGRNESFGRCDPRQYGMTGSPS